MIRGRGEHDFAIRASRGALDFIRKPVDVDYFVTSLL
jgi:FixJ family two-component response regulator